MNKCGCCGEDYKLNQKDKLLRKMVTLQAKMFPGLKEVAEQAKNYCNDCWKDAVKPIAESIAGVKSID